MKIITNTVAYVQKKDIDFLKQCSLDIPSFIISKTFGINTINENNEYEFVKFSKKNEIEYFNNLDWIIDYNEIKKLNEDEIIQKCKDIANEINKIADKYNKMSEQKKEKHADMFIRCELLNYKMNSLRDALWFKQGHINIQVPVVFDYQQNKKEDKNILKTLFKKKNT